MAMDTPPPAWVGIVAVLVTTLFPVVKWITGLFNKKDKPTEAELTLTTIPLIYDGMTAMCGDTDAVRVAILMTSNGGGIPSPGKNQYVSMLYEVIDPEKVSPLRPQYQELLLEEDNVRMLSTALVDKAWQGATSDMPEGLSKIIAENQEVTHTRIIPIGRNKVACYFLQVQWITETGGLPKSEDTYVHAQMALIANKLAHLLNL